MQEAPQEAPATVDDLRSEFGGSIEIFASPPAWAEALGLGLVGNLPVAAPRDEEAAAALVAWAGKLGRAFCAVGGGTKLGVGAVPSRCDFLLSTKYLDEVYDFDAGNSTVEAGAGLSLDGLDAHVRRSRQLVPLESWDGATLGGVAASNSHGARSPKWGAPRDLVLGARALLSDGREVRGGGKVVKNVSGYDLPKLFVGSRGSLGLLTRITLRLRPQPERSLRAVWARPSLDEVASLWRDLSGRDFDWSGARASFEGGDWRLSAWCEGFESAVSSQLSRAPQPDSIEEAAGAASEGAWLEAVQVSARVPLSRGHAWASAAQRSSASRLWWDCASGSLRVAWNEVAWEDVAALREMAEQGGGWLVLERGPREWKSPESVWGHKRGDWFLMHKIKAAYDPANVCTPGRGPGGL